MASLKRLLLVEDELKDLKFASDTARSIGIEEIEARTTLQAARSYLDKALQDEVPLPDCIVLDLNLGYESGYELLRYWHSTPRLAQIPVIVWSILGDEQREMCKLFKVDFFVAKWEGAEAFRDALVKLQQSPSQ
jgi:CheY-like chemotaxis protein